MKTFDKVHSHYDNFMKLFNLYKTNDILPLLDIRDSEIIVDIGGGTGHLAKQIAPICSQIYVLDESEGMLSKIDKKTNIIPILGNALHTPFDNNSIDTVILTDVFHHIKEQNKLLDEIQRILKPTGKLILMDFHKYHIKTIILRIFERVMFGKLYFKSKNEIISLLTRYFEIQTIKDYKYYFIIRLVQKNLT